MEILLPEYKELLLTLQKHEVEFLLIGGYAVIYYGYERPTLDMDVWVKPDNATKSKLVKALEEYGIEDEGIEYVQSLDFTQPQAIFLGKKPRRIDILTKVKHVEFSEAISKAKYFHLKGIPMPVIDYEHLVLTKISTGRLKDKADIDELQRIAKLRKNK